MSSCRFIDSTVIGAIIRNAQALARDGHALALAAPPANRAVRSVLEIVGIASLGTLLDEAPAFCQGAPNQVVSASRNPTSVPSPTQAT